MVSHACHSKMAYSVEPRVAGFLPAGALARGANVVAALRVHETLGDGAAVSTVLCDSNRTYLDGPLMREVSVRDGFLTPRTSFVGFRAINRSCQTCVDPQDTASYPTGIFEMAKRLERRGGR